MKSVICTIFEGHYHHGVGVLVNSLYKQGFRGDVFAGFKGKLPLWAKATKANEKLQWEQATTLVVTNDLRLHFLPLKTDYHLTNYKPNFMRTLLNGPASNADAIFYYDPDIVQVAPWPFMIEWVGCGLAVCEDINSPLEEFHPKRVYWRKYFDHFRHQLQFKNHIYANGGFVGVHIRDTAFLECWQQIQEAMGKEIGGLNRSAFVKSDQLTSEHAGDFAPFGKTDQDALNAAIEAYNGIVSYATKEAMGFDNGILLLAHALGDNKPWLHKPLKLFFKGSKPRMVDKLFWQNASSPIEVYRSSKAVYMNKLTKMAAFLGRFYSK